MRYILAVFSTRHDAIAFYDKLVASRVCATIVSTPREVTTSCGVSVKFLFEAFRRVRDCAYNYNSFVAFYLVEERYGKKHITLL